MALGETVIDSSPSHHYVRLRSLLPFRLSSFPFVWSLLYASPVFPFYSLATVIFVGDGPIAGAIYSSGCLLLTPLFVLHFCYSCCVFLTLFYLEFILSRLVLLTLGLTSAKGRSHVQLIRAELSSNGSSEPLSESLSKLSSHQIPRCLGSEGPLQLKGCTRTSSMFSPTTPSGASVLCACSFALSTPLRPRGRTGVFRRREGPPRQPLSGIPLLPPLPVRPFSLTRRFLMPRSAACGSALPVDPLSLLLVLRLLS